MNKRFWLTGLTAALLATGAVWAGDDAEKKPEGERPRRQMRPEGEGMERGKNSAEFKAMRERRGAIMKQMKAYRKAAEADKPALETEIKALLKQDLELTLQEGRARLAENRARLDEMEKKLNERAAAIDQTVDGEFERMKSAPEGRGPGHKNKPNGEKRSDAPRKGKKAATPEQAPAPEAAPAATAAQ